MLFPLFFVFFVELFWCFVAILCFFVAFARQGKPLFIAIYLHNWQSDF